MAKSQRTKGAVYEREIAHELATYFGVPVKRNIGQARDGGNDLDLGLVKVECKRRKQLGTIQGWINQAKAACGPEHLPVVIARQDHGDSLVVCDLTTFLELAGERIARDLPLRQE